MCSTMLQLTPGSRDISQAEKEINVCKAEQIHKMTTQNGSWMQKVVILSEVKQLSFCEFAQLEINHVIQQPTEENQRTCRPPRTKMKTAENIDTMAITMENASLIVFTGFVFGCFSQDLAPLYSTVSAAGFVVHIGFGWLHI